MGERPFKCGNCGNWYIKVPTPGECWSCAEDKHGRHLKTGIVDCHWGQQSATPSETRMVEVLQLCQMARQEAESTVSKIKQGDDVVMVLSKAERAFAAAERAAGEIPDILQWAAVMEMPGQQGSRFDQRYKTLDTLRLLVEDGRRPPEDVMTLERSLAVCEEIAAEVPETMARARVALGNARHAAETRQEPTITPATTTPIADGFAKARAAKAAKLAKKREMVTA